MTDQDRKTAEEVVRAITADITWDGSLPADRFRFHVERVAAALSAARGRWIPVGEGLPEIGSDEDYAHVLVLNKDGQFTADYYPSGAWVGGDGFLIGITHWRELPEPPQEGGNNGA